MLLTSNNGNYTAGVTLPFTVCCLISLSAYLFFDFSTRAILFSAAFGYVLASVLKMVIDWQTDPTSHNLFPFEIIISAIIGLVAGVVGTAAGLILKKIIKICEPKNK